MESIIYSPEAICSIIFDCYSVRRNSETGGILVGPTNNNRIVTDIIPSSVHAERGFATYFQTEQDVEILNQQLRDFQQKGYDFKGYYHKHPSGMFTLSAGDRATCLEILKDPDYKINNYLIMCIVTKSRVQAFPVFSYAVNLLNPANITVKRTEIKILPKTCIKEFMDFIEPNIKELRNEGIYTKQYSGKIEEYRTNDPLRSSNQKQDNYKLPERKARTLKDREISEKETASHRDPNE